MAASFFDEVTLTETVKVDDGHSILVRGLSWAERQLITHVAAVVANGNSHVLGNAMNTEAAKFVIVAWEGPKFDGRPVSPANIEALPAWVVDKAIDAAMKLSAPPDEDEKKESAAPTKS
jgi:hypothetical protein